MYNRETFNRWLLLIGESNASARSIIEDVEIVARYYKKYTVGTFEIWNVEDPAKIGAIICILSKKEKNNKDLSLKSRMDSLYYYEEYLLVIEIQKEKHPNWDVMLANYQTKLNETMALLEERYSAIPAYSLNELIESNKDIDFTSLSTWTKALYGKTAREYLCEEGIISKRIRKRSFELLDDEESSYITGVVELLNSKYSQAPAETLRQIEDENSEIDFRFFNEATKRQYNETAKEHLVRKGLIKKPIVDRRTNLDKVIELLNVLIKKYSSNPAKGINQIVSETPNFPMSEFNRLSEKVYGRSAEELLRKWGVIRKKEDKIAIGEDKKSKCKEKSVNSSVIESAKSEQEHFEWGEYEAVILIDQFHSMLQRELPKNLVASIVSGLLKDRANALGQTIDPRYTSLIEITRCLSELEYIYSYGKKGTRCESEVFKHLMKMHRHDRVKFFDLLNLALNGEYAKPIVSAVNSVLENDVTIGREIDDVPNNSYCDLPETLAIVEEQQMIDSDSSFRDSVTVLSFGEWLQLNCSNVYTIVLSYFNRVDEKLRGASFAQRSILEIDNADELKPYVSVIEQVVFDSKGQDEAMNGILKYMEYLQNL